KHLLSQITPAEPIKPLLDNIIAILLQLEEPDLSAIASPIFSYAVGLRNEGQHALIEDTLQPILSRAKRTHNAPLIIKASLDLAFAARTLGKFEEAEDYYRSAGKHARMIGDIRSTWLSRGGKMKLLAIT